MTMRLTLDGLLRALRAEAHRLAEEIERGYPGEVKGSRPPAPGGDETTRFDDDRARR